MHDEGTPLAFWAGEKGYTRLGDGVRRRHLINPAYLRRNGKRV